LISYVNAKSAGGSGAGTTATTAAMDSTTANFAVIAATVYNVGSTTITISDSATGNSWTALTSYNNAAAVVQLFYCANLVTSATHTFSAYGDYPGLAVALFSGVATVTPKDQSTGSSSASSTTIQPGSITPGSANEVVVTGVGVPDHGYTYSINSSFNIASQITGGSGTNAGVGIAYIIQTTATAENPTWTISTADVSAAAIASFIVQPASTLFRQRAGTRARLLTA